MKDTLKGLGYCAGAVFMVFGLGIVQGKLSEQIGDWPGLIVVLIGLAVVLYVWKDPGRSRDKK